MSTEQTQGSLTKEAIRLAWPAVCESFFIALAGMVDTFMVSTLGANAVAAVGLTTQPKFLGLALFIAANVAISALVARRFGEKRQQHLLFFKAGQADAITACFSEYSKRLLKRTKSAKAPIREQIKEADAEAARQPAQKLERTKEAVHEDR